MTAAAIGWVTSWAIEAVSCPIAVTRLACASLFDAQNKLAQNKLAIGMREFVLRVPPALFRLPAFGHVDRRSDEPAHVAGWVQNGMADDVELLYGAVGG